MPRINDMPKEVIEKNFLSQESDEIPTDVKVVVAKEIPAYERVLFQNNRDPGCTLYFHYCSKTHPLKHYTLAHGLEYDLPVEVIKHLEGQNKSDPYSCHSRIYSERKNYEGMPENYVSGYKPYFQLRSVRA
jgi:hypothetical protein